MRNTALTIALLFMFAFTFSDLFVIDDTLNSVSESQEFIEDTDTQNRRSDANTTPFPTTVPTVVPVPTFEKEEPQ
jgi:hypothetical protein